MTAYNEEHCIDKAIKSIQDQTFMDWELIIVNDASNDRTKEVIKKYLYQEPRIHLINNEKNLGLAASLNIGLKFSQAEFIARADADDINLPKRLDKQYSFMQKNKNVDVLGTGAWLLDSLGHRISRVILPSTHNEIVKLPFLKTKFFHSSVIVRRRFFDKVGLYDESYLRSQDKELWMRGVYKGCNYANLPEPLIEYATNDYNRSWGTIFERIKALFKMVRTYQVKNGYTLILKSLTYSLLVKMHLYKPVVLRNV